MKYRRKKFTSWKVSCMPVPEEIPSGHWTLNKYINKGSLCNCVCNTVKHNWKHSFVEILLKCHSVLGISLGSPLATIAALLLRHKTIVPACSITHEKTYGSPYIRWPYVHTPSSFRFKINSKRVCIRKFLHLFR